MTKNVRTIAVVLAAIVLVVGTYIGYERHARRGHVIAMVNDTAARLRTTLQAQGSEGAGGDAAAHAKATDAHLTALRKMNASSFRPLADAADDYLLTSREILRRVADIRALGARVSLSFDALNAHVKGDRGRGDWTAEAVRLKDVLDKDAREYRIAVESYAALIQTLPASQVKIAPYVEYEALIEQQTIDTARKRTLDAFAAADQNIRQIANLGGARR